MNSQISGCLLCHQAVFDEISTLFELKSVTSDYKPWPHGNIIQVCQHCGHVQTKITPLWEEEVAHIYSQYVPYSVSEGEEQTVFASNANYPQARSSLILKQLCSLLNLPEMGYLLDVGCGNGAFLRAFNQLFPKWKLAGFEQNQLHYDEVMQIKGVEHFYTSTNEINRDFDLIGLVHVLEHIPQPSVFLKQLCKNLKKEGRFLIQVPHFLENPFDLVIKDHCSHFTPMTLKWLAEYSGFKVLAKATDWIPKEISIILCPAVMEQSTQLNSEFYQEISKSVQNNINWLQTVIKQANEEAETAKQFGILGTAIAGSWLAGILGSKVHFFVDEDTQRTGKMYLDHPVLRISELPNDSVVYIAFPRKIAQQIYERIQPLWTQTKFIIPPQIRSF